MNASSNFDPNAAHKFFSADCFNKAWELIAKENRTPEEDEQMIRLNQASIWHWTQREDCTDKNLSIGYWQASRIHALLGQAEEARRYGQLALDYAEKQTAFYQAYGYEALARAEQVAGNKAEVEQHLKSARSLAEEIADPEEKKILLDDLDAIG